MIIMILAALEERHTPMALRMLAELCDTDPHKRREAEETAKAALQARIALWDGVLEEITTAHRVEEVHDSIACIP